MEYWAVYLPWLGVDVCLHIGGSLFNTQVFSTMDLGQFSSGCGSGSWLHPGLHFSYLLVSLADTLLLHILSRIPHHVCVEFPTNAASTRIRIP